MKKFFAVVMVLVLCLSMVSALAESDVEYIKNKGTFVVGITDFAPMDYRDESGNWIGVDADLAKAFAESMGVAVEFIEIDWDNKILELNSKTIDCVWNGMTLTDEVKSAMECTAPYLDNSQVVVMDAEKLAALPEEASQEELAAFTYAVEAGSAGEAVANELGFTTTPVSSQAAALMEVAAGTSDAAVIDYLMAAAMVGEGTSYANLSFDYPLNDEQYGIGFRSGSDAAALCDAFLAESVQNGLMNTLLVQYGLIAAE